MSYSPPPPCPNGASISCRVTSCHLAVLTQTKCARAGGRSGACTERSTTTTSRSCRFLFLKTRVPSTHTDRYGAVWCGVDRITQSSTTLRYWHRLLLVRFFYHETFSILRRNLRRCISWRDLRYKIYAGARRFTLPPLPSLPLSLENFLGIIIRNSYLFIDISFWVLFLVPPPRSSHAASAACALSSYRNRNRNRNRNLDPVFSRHGFRPCLGLPSPAASASAFRGSRRASRWTTRCRPRRSRAGRRYLCCDAMQCNSIIFL